jgi:hypothetical protein
MRSFLLCPLLLVVLLFSNCTKKVTEVVQPNLTILTTLQPNNWKYDAASGTYYNDVSVPEIDDRVVQTNGVLAYITFDDLVYEAVPDVLDGITFICRYQKGIFTVESQSADGSPSTAPTRAIGLKIVLIDSDY